MLDSLYKLTPAECNLPPDCPYTHSAMDLCFRLLTE